MGLASRPAVARASNFAERLAQSVTLRAGSSGGFAVAALIVCVWALLGPFFDYSDTWQLVINTGTTIVTFLMVFLIQRTQNKDALAIQLKLNEIVAALEGASNRLISVEDMNEEDLQLLHTHYQQLAQMAKHAANLTQSHSIEEARNRHEAKEHTRPHVVRRSQRSRGQNV